ncbi:hypothetical protein T4C_11382 [Trichinella pseudospiralis]|uniref:Uncharacterized protein n=1 Tax=Trichinella pseudospiralis TaxID=6337 RepID=A0A0V1J3F5_TRIPS|nr:hypothetical protein T4C_11382 [Trichinella pseudospiralis]
MTTFSSLADVKMNYMNEGTNNNLNFLQRCQTEDFLSIELHAGKRLSAVDSDIIHSSMIGLNDHLEIINK